MSVLSLAEVKTHLNMTTSADDTELQRVINAAEGIIGEMVGPLEPTPQTTVVDCIGYPAFTLPIGPLVRVDSITGSAYLGSHVVDTTYTTVNTRDGVAFIGYRAPGLSEYGPYVVTYTAGWDAVPDAVLMAVLELVRHLWETQRGSGASRPGARTDAAPIPGAAYALPIRVEQLLEPYRLPGIA